MARSLLERTFSWSVSRDRLFRTCRRAYYYRYYGSWGGWEPGADPAVRELYVLKQLKTRHQWVGDAVHGVLREVLRGLRHGRLTPPAEADARLTHVMRISFRASRDGGYRRDPKQGGLVEHEYATKVAVADWRALHEEARRALAAAYGLGLFDRLAAIPPNDWLGVEAFDTFELDGVPVHCVPDFAFREGAAVVIVDWKTGPPAADEGAGTRFQLACYGLFALARWEPAPERLRLGVALLGVPEYRESAVSAAELAEVEARIRQSVAAMRALLADRGANVARVEDFPQTEDTGICGRCPYRRPCRGAAWQATAA